MSNKGIPQTEITKQKISLANRKDRTELTLKVKNYIMALTPQDFPSLTRCAIYAGISEKTLLSIEARTAENSELRSLLEFIRDLSKASLLEGGLYKTFDSRMSQFLLEANHGLKKEAPQLTQNNFFQGLTPELLSEALEISKTNSKKTGNQKNGQSK